VSKPVWNSEIRKFKVGHHPENFGTYGTSHQNKLSGSWYTYPSEKYELVSWDDDILNIWKTKMFQTTNQL